MNAEEIEVCIEKYGTDIYRFCCFLTGSRTLADDLYQDTFLKALEINKTITVADAKKYLIGITANLWKNQWRKEKRRQKIAPSHVLTEEDLSDSPSEYSAATTPDLLTSCIHRETSAMLRAAIHDLPEKYRVIVLMYYSVDLSTKEIAEQLHISKGTVTSRLQRSREKIKEKLEEMGYER